MPTPYQEELNKKKKKDRGPVTPPAVPDTTAQTFKAFDEYGGSALPPPPRPKPVASPDRPRMPEAPGGALGAIREALYGAFPKLGEYLERQKEQTYAAYRPAKDSPFEKPIAPGGGGGFDLASLPVAGPAPAGAPTMQAAYTPPVAAPTGTATDTVARGAQPPAPPAGGAEDQVDWTQLGFSTQEEGSNWARAFAAEHGGNMPWEEGTMSPEQNLQEHMAALRFGQKFQETTGRAPGEGDYRAEWFKTRFGLGPNWRISGAARGGGMGYMPQKYLRS